MPDTEKAHGVKVGRAIRTWHFPHPTSLFIAEFTLEVVTGILHYKLHIVSGKCFATASDFFGEMKQVERSFKHVYSVTGRGEG